MLPYSLAPTLEAQGSRLSPANEQQESTSRDEGRQSTSTTNWDSVIDSRVRVISKYRVPNVPEAELTQSSRVPRVPEAAMAYE